MGVQGAVLLIDTCEERASVALCAGSALMEERMLPERAASATVSAAVRQMLQAHRVSGSELLCVGVVSGPGSFTGVRVGLAFAKGLCLASGIPLVTVSRLALLAEAAGLTSGYAVLGAGRGAVYLRGLAGPHPGWERMVGNADARQLLAAAEVACTTESLAVELGIPAGRVRVIALSAALALRPVLARLSAGVDELKSSDANYVRDEQAIYRTPRTGAPRA